MRVQRAMRRHLFRLPRRKTRSVDDLPCIRTRKHYSVFIPVQLGPRRDEECLNSPPLLVHASCVLRLVFALVLCSFCGVPAEWIIGYKYGPLFYWLTPTKTRRRPDPRQKWNKSEPASPGQKYKRQQASPCMSRRNSNPVKTEIVQQRDWIAGIVRLVGCPFFDIRRQASFVISTHI